MIYDKLLSKEVFNVYYLKGSDFYRLFKTRNKFLI